MAMNSVAVQRQNPLRVLLWFAWVCFAWFVAGRILGRLSVPLPNIVEVLSILGGAGAGLGAIFAVAYLATSARSKKSLLVAGAALLLNAIAFTWFWFSLPG
jgi:hypothetical protein